MYDGFGKGLEGVSPSLIEVLSRHSTGRTDENHADSQRG